MFAVRRGMLAHTDAMCATCQRQEKQRETKRRETNVITKYRIHFAKFTRLFYFSRGRIIINAYRLLVSGQMNLQIRI